MKDVLGAGAQATFFTFTTDAARQRCQSYELPSLEGPELSSAGPGTN